METNDSIHRDVEKELLSKERKHRRPDGEAVYCSPYTKDMVDFDNWNFMFQTKYCFRGQLTMNHFETPPQMVLDLGCGCGLWVIEAAKQWKKSKFIGFDFLDHLQPRVGLTKDVAQRIEWVQGNFLESLPFPSNYFDFVRGVGLSFHVPEDESSFVLEEIYRIVKPGGVLETIEEDLIFPHSRTPSPSRSVSLEIGHEDLVFPSDNSPTCSFGDSASRLSFGLDSTDPDSSGSETSSQERLIPVKGSSRQSISQQSVPTRLSEHRNPVDPRDHSQLQMAWDAMLQKRFLAPCYTTVCLLYFQATYTVKAHPLLQIPLPPSSWELGESSSLPNLGKHFDTSTSCRRQSTQNAIPNEDKSTMDSQRISRMSPWASMHLAKTVRTVIGCKENIWEAYQELFDQQSSDRHIVRSSGYKNEQDAELSGTVRDAFEAAWFNWESDMKDRIGFRSNMLAELMWTEPDGDTPDWRVWRNSLEPSHDDQGLAHDVDICRSMRAIVGWKST